MKKKQIKAKAFSLKKKKKLTVRDLELLKGGRIASGGGDLEPRDNGDSGDGPQDFTVLVCVM